MAESFVDTFKTELIADRVWAHPVAARARDRRVLAWFNTTRLHGAPGDIPPAEFETLHALQSLQPSPSPERGNHQTGLRRNQPGSREAPGRAGWHTPQITKTGGKKPCPTRRALQDENRKGGVGQRRRLRTVRGSPLTQPSMRRRLVVIVPADVRVRIRSV